MSDEPESHETVGNNRSYEVGYQRPPKSSQFKPGQSGNPTGRPRTLPSLSRLVDQALARRVQIREGDQVRRVSKLSGIVEVMVNLALKGNYRMLTLVLKEIQREHRETDIDSEEQQGALQQIWALIEASSNQRQAEALVDDFARQLTTPPPETPSPVDPPPTIKSPSLSLSKLTPAQKAALNLPPD